MARSYRFLQLDVFTGHIFGGNQLAVFPDARGLTTQTMQAVAKEMNFSETTFVVPAERPDTDVRLRIFTPEAELPMAGHPTIGSTFALALDGAIPVGAGRFVFGLGVGPIPVALTWRDASLSFAWMTQMPPVFHDPLPDRALAAAALGLDEAEISVDLPVQVVSCGVPYVLVPVTTRQAVDRAVLNRPAYDDLMSRASAGMTGLFFFSREAAVEDEAAVKKAAASEDPAGSDDATVYSRMFAPDLGVSEDAATGSASGPLGCYLVRHQVVGPEQAGAMLSLQGVKMGRPSHVHISIGVENGEIRSVRVGGEAVLAGEGTLYIP